MISASARSQQFSGQTRRQYAAEENLRETHLFQKNRSMTFLSSFAFGVSIRG